MSRMGAMVRVIHRGEVVRSSVELGTPRQLQKMATAALGRVSGDAVTISRDGKKLMCRSRSAAGAYGKWLYTEEGRKLCAK